MALVTIVTLAVLASKHLTNAAPAPPSYSNPRCIDLSLPITASTTNNKLMDIIHPDDQINATACAVDLDTFGAPTVDERVIRNLTISGTYNIAAYLCVPKKLGAKADILQIASHGAIYDSRYWDIRVDPSEYSYVDNALDAGYSILTYDRIGTGRSDKPDAYTVVQTPLQADILREITVLARSGDLTKHAVHNAQNVKTNFKKFVHVGHSQGSFITLNFLGLQGNLSDGALLTGVLPTTKRTPIHPTSLDIQYAALADPSLFSAFGKGYIVPPASGVQTGFLSTLRNYTAGLGGFTPELKDYSDKIKQPMAITEILVSEVVGVPPAPEFAAPMQFFLGEYDFLNCNGNCTGAEDRPLLDALYPNATDIDVQFQPGTGHGLPFHLGAKVGYQTMFQWLEKNGL